MLSFMTVATQLVSWLLTMLLTGLFGIPSLVGGVKKTPPAVPADFTPVLRFAVCSDVHLNGEADQPAAIRLGELFDVCYAEAEADGAYQGLDAVIVAGDFATSGAPEEYALFNEIVSAHKREETKLLTVLGNHEFISYRDEDASVGYDVYREYINPEVDTHDVINGFHFICVSYDPDGKRFTGKKELIQMIENYIRYYNTQRVQRNLGVLTPMEKHKLSLAA